MQSSSNHTPTMTSQVESLFGVNRLHNTITRRKELKIILWRLLDAPSVGGSITALSVQHEGRKQNKKQAMITLHRMAKKGLPVFIFYQCMSRK